MNVAPSGTVRVWIAGDYADAVRAVREFCERGACFAVTPCDYVYTGGMESGICASRINYPRFPAEPKAILDQCVELGHFLRERLFQDSFSVETPTETLWFTRREITT